MKKAKIIGKKTLSVFLAVLMVLTAWVWVAPTEAEAATAGKYKIAFCVYDNGNGAAGVTALTIKYKTKANNGSGTESSEKTVTTSVSDASTYLKNGKNYYILHVDNADFPSYVYAASEVGSWEYPEFRIKVMVAKSGTTNYTQGSTSTDWKEITDFEFHSKAFLGSNTGSASTTSFSNTPTVSSVKYVSGATSITLPKIGASQKTNTYVFGVYDQYGVRMTYDPTYYIKTTQPSAAQSSSDSIAGVSMASSTGVLTTQDSAQMMSGDSKTIYVHAKYGSLYANKAVTLNDPEYTYKFNKNTTDSSAVISPSVDTTGKYYNTFGNATISGTRTGFTFQGFYQSAFEDSYETVKYSGTKLSSNTYYTNDVTWYAAWQANNYVLTFNYKDEDYKDVVYIVDKYFGQTYEMPEYPEVIEIKVGDVTNYKYEFLGWKVGDTLVTPSTTIPDKDVTYLADYTETVYYADLDALNDAIDAAEAKRSEKQYIDGGYTDETVSIFESALTTAEYAQEAGYLLSNQHIVDNATENLINALNGLVPRKYIVIFVDEDGTILKDGYNFVDYGAKVELLNVPEQAPDADYHYSFDSWDTTLSDDVDELDYVTSDLKYVANFTATPHTYIETVTPSTCTEDGVITKTCTCDYSYSVVNPDDLANHKWSTDYKELVPATCATKGTEAKYCTACGAIDESTKRDIAELGHYFGAYTEYTPATCFGEGSEIAECSRCGGKNVRKLAQKTHAYGTAEEIEKTCTTDGYTKEVCTLCGFTNIRDIDIAKGHTLSVETLPETCVSVGYAKTTCANCDFEKTTVYPATGVHTFIDNWTTVSEASCVGHGVEKRVCTVCKAATETRLTDLAAHTEPADWTTEKEAWCGLEGRKVKDCTVCGKELATEVIPALSHNYEEYVDGSYAETCTSAGAEAEKCSRCGDINITVVQPLGHDWNSGVRTEATCTSGGYITYTCQRDNCGEKRVELIDGSAVTTHTWTKIDEKAADCENDGYIDYKCSVCDKATKREILPKLGHAYPETWTVEKEATNNEDGKWTRKCANCKNVEELTIPKGGHNLVEDKDAYKAPKCNEKGQQVYKCDAHDNCPIKVTVELDYAEHTIAQRITSESCTQLGTVEAYCSACNKVFNTEEIPVKAHNFEVQTAVAPTCTTAGYTPYKCSVCGFTYNVVNDAQATGHNYKVTTTAATCTATGLKTFTCDCGDSYTEEIPVIAHTYTKDSETAATCATLGTETYKCTCGDSYTIYVGVIDKSNHSWKGWETVKEATNDSDGYKINECTACGCKDIEIISATGSHIFSIKDDKASQAPTCTEDGYDVLKCSAHTGCTATSTVPVSKLGHNAVVEYTAPTCIAEGSSKVVCATCKETLDRVVIPATGIHDFSGEGVITAPGCTTEGEITYTCETDGCTETKKDKIPAKGHTFTTTVTDAKCGEKGSVVTECKVCNDSTVKTVTELAAKGHIWGATPIKTEAADCENNGSETYKCENCDKTNVVVIPALGHDWNDWTVVPSTNGSVGSVSRTCKRETCKKVESVEIPAGGHNLVATTTKDATCTDVGSIIYTCEKHSDCGITVTVTIPAKGHTNVIETIPATCEKDGSIIEKCGICENVIHKTTVIPKKGHAWDKGVVTKNATCTTPGVKTYTCANDAEHTYEETIPVTGHKITAVTTLATCIQEGSVVEKCSRCGYKETVATIPMLQHDYSGEVTDKKDATCTEDGSKTIQCKTEGCTATTTVVIPHTGHTWNAWTITKPATNTADGEMTRTCSNGKCTETVVIPKGGHIWDNGTVTKDATCTETGTMVYKCNNAAHVNCTASYEVAISIKEHTIAQREIESTCKVEGSVEAYCSKCNRVLSTETIPVKAHVYKAGTAVAPTCTTSGYTPYTCTCGASYNEYDAAKPATGHNLVEGISTATCVGAGEMTLSCNNSGCNYSRTVNVPALGHNYKKVSDTNATCAAASTETYKCSRCTASYTISVGEKSAEHTWDETKWQVQVSATPSSLGYKTNACTVCGQLKVETIPATGEHNFNKENGRQNATCTTDGWIKYDCSTHTNCGLTSTVTIPATGHTEAHEYKAATCTDDGYSRMVCSVESCKKVLAETVIPELGHLYGEGTVTNATCNTEGKIEYTCTRENCGAKHETVIATNSNAHQYVTVVKDSTCTVPGKVVTKCDLCNDEIEVKTLPLIEHTWNDGEIKEGDNATCTADGKKTFTCTCGATKIEVIAKLGHDWGAWTETKASTNNDKGVLTRTCSRGCTETAEIPAGGHNLVVDSANSKVPSCTESGYTKYICNVKHTGDVDCGITVTVNLDKLQHKLETTSKDATCEGTGSVVTKCTKCETSTFTTTIPAKGHTYNDGVKTDATCTKEGKIVYTCTADKCGKTKEVILDKLQHNYVAGTPVAATCTASGYTPYKCATCESSYVILGEAANGHSYTEKVSSSATCISGGTMILKCACGETMETPVPALGHDYKLINSTEATCAAGATETYECSGCNDTYTEVVSSKLTNEEAHKWGDWVVEKKPTPTSIGYKTSTCDTCGKVKVEAIGSTGDHEFTIKIVEESKEATCTENGYDVLRCSKHENCQEKSTIIVPKLGHTEQLIYSAATCTSEGSASIYCDVCKKTLSTEKIPVLNHVWGDEVITQPTCNSTGSVVFKCGGANCTETKTVIIPENENAHKLTMDAKLATCKEAGYVKVTCTNEGCTYNEETNLPMLHHDWSTWKKTDSTNDKAGSWVSICSICKDERKLEIPAGGHKFENTPVTITEATCKNEGKVVYKCSAHDNCGVEVTVKTAMLLHEYETKTESASCSKEGSVTVSCRVCGHKLVDNMATAKLPHEYTDTKTDATCTEAGYITYTCEKCGDSYDKFVSQPIGHTYTKVTTDPTCTTAGYTTYKCSVCGQGYTSDFVEASGHKYNQGEKTDATCTTAGKIVYTCTAENCGHSYEVTLSMLNHEYDVENTVDPTCTANGYTTYKCKNCNSSYVVIGDPAKGHNYDANGDGKVDKNDAVFEDGKYTYTCSLCGETITEDADDLFEVRFFDAEGKLIEDATQNVKFGERAVAPAAPEKKADGTYHYEFSAWDRYYSKITSDLDVYPTFEKEAHYGGEATCTTLAKCEKCNAYYGEYDESKHTVATKSKAASCETDGWIEYYCTNAGCKYNYNTGVALKKETIGASGHVYGQWTVIQNGTCEIPQIQQRKCVNYGCDKIEERRTQSTHTWLIEPRVEPTCTTVGYSEFRYCVTCNLQIDRVEIPKTDHRDLDGNGYCDYCGTSKGAPKCNCMCHSTGIMKFFYTIVRFFWIITRSSPSCSCGAVHY